MADENILNPGLESITGHPSDGSSGSGSVKGKNMTLGDFKGLQSQVVGIGEGNLKLGLLLTDFLVRLAHLQGLDPEKELAAEKEQHEKEQEKIHKQEEKAKEQEQDDVNRALHQGDYAPDAPTHATHRRSHAQEPDAPTHTAQDDPSRRLHGTFPSNEPDVPITKAHDASKHQQKKDEGTSWL